MQKNDSNENYFPTQKRFSDTMGSTSTFVLDSDMIVFGKSLQCGTVLTIAAWRDIDNVPYLVVSKGTWESLILYDDVKHLLNKNY